MTKNNISNIEKVLKLDQETQGRSSTFREFLLITLIHAEVRLFTDRGNVLSRVRELFECRAIVIAREKHHKNQGECSGPANCLERIQQYMVIEQEPKPSKAGVPPAYWPASGDLRVEKLSARYSPVSALE